MASAASGAVQLKEVKLNIDDSRHTSRAASPLPSPGVAFHVQNPPSAIAASEPTHLSLEDTDKIGQVETRRFAQSVTISSGVDLSSRTYEHLFQVGPFDQATQEQLKELLEDGQLIQAGGLPFNVATFKQLRDLMGERAANRVIMLNPTRGYKEKGFIALTLVLATMTLVFFFSDTQAWIDGAAYPMAAKGAIYAGKALSPAGGVASLLYGRHVKNKTQEAQTAFVDAGGSEALMLADRWDKFIEMLNTAGLHFAFCTPGADSTNAFDPHDLEEFFGSEWANMQACKDRIFKFCKDWRAHGYKAKMTAALGKCIEKDPADPKKISRWADEIDLFVDAVLSYEKPKGASLMNFVQRVYHQTGLSMRNRWREKMDNARRPQEAALLRLIPLMKAEKGRRDLAAFAVGAPVPAENAHEWDQVLVGDAVQHGRKLSTVSITSVSPSRRESPAAATTGRAGTRIFTFDDDVFKRFLQATAAAQASGNADALEGESGRVSSRNSGSLDGARALVKSRSPSLADGSSRASSKQGKHKDSFDPLDVAISVTPPNATPRSALPTPQAAGHAAPGLQLDSRSASRAEPTELLRYRKASVTDRPEPARATGSATPLAATPRSAVPTPTAAKGLKLGSRNASRAAPSQGDSLRTSKPQTPVNLQAVFHAPAATPIAAEAVSEAQQTSALADGGLRTESASGLRHRRTKSASSIHEASQAPAASEDRPESVLEQVLAGMTQEIAQLKDKHVDGNKQFIDYESAPAAGPAADAEKPVVSEKSDLD